jgi:hypothetical protein
MVHLFQMNVSAGGDIFIKCWFPIRQRSLGSDLKGAALVLPNQVAMFCIAQIREPSASQTIPISTEDARPAIRVTKRIRQGIYPPDDRSVVGW